jgi:chromosome segregation ATPase
MSTIGSTSSIPTFDPTLQIQTAQQIQQTSGTTDPATTDPQSPAPYLSLPFPRYDLDSLGLTVPGDVNDVSILIAKVGLALDEIFGKNQNEALSSQAESRRSALAAALVLQQSITALGARNDQLTGDIKNWESEKKGLVDQRTDLQSQRSARQTDINAVNGQIATTTTAIAAIDAQLKTATDPKVIEQLNADRAGLVTKLNGLNTQKASLTSEIASLTTKIDELTAKIDVLQGKIDAAEAEKVTNSKKIDAYTLQLADLSSLLALARAQDGTLESGMVKDSELAAPLEELADAIEAFDLRFGDLKAFEALQTIREGDQEAVQRVAQKAVALISAISEVLQTLLGLEPPPSVEPRDSAMLAGNRFRLPA